MHLNKEDIAALKRLQKYQNRFPNFLSKPGARELPVWIFFTGYIAVSVVAIASAAYSSCGWLMLGFGNGIICMLLRMRWHWVDRWHLTREITDWKRVDELIREHEKYIV